VIRRVEVHAACHITGGGIAANLARVLPRGMSARVERSTWTPSPVFQVTAGLAGADLADLESTLNLGIGMILVVAPEAADAALGVLRDRRVPAWVAGSIRATEGDAPPSAELTGRHPA